MTFQLASEDILGSKQFMKYVSMLGEEDEILIEYMAGSYCNSVLQLAQARSLSAATEA